jgi:hypothetical protein
VNEGRFTLRRSSRESEEEQDGYSSSYKGMNATTQPSLMRIRRVMSRVGRKNYESPATGSLVYAMEQAMLRSAVSG